MIFVTRLACLALIALLALPCHARAADAPAPSVEINMDTLDKFSPRPPEAMPLTFPEREADEKPVAKQAPPLKKPPQQDDDLQSYKPPPMFEADAPNAQPAETTDDDPSGLLPMPSPSGKRPVASKPPIPPRRPAIMKAPDSFIRQARENLRKIYPGKISKPARPKLGTVPVPSAVRPASPAQPAPVIPIDAENLNANLGANLNQPTAQDVLKAIESGVAEPRSSLASLAFPKDGKILDDNMKVAIGREVLPKIAASDEKVEIESFAAATAQSDPYGEARRLSLIRAIATRDFLIGMKVDPHRIVLLPLGAQTPKKGGNPTPDRVDIYLGESRHH